MALGLKGFLFLTWAFKCARIKEQNSRNKTFPGKAKTTGRLAMASINLLPQAAEEKGKFEKEGKPLIRRIELTSPPQPERDRRGARRGVFAFLSNLFGKKAPKFSIEEVTLKEALPGKAAMRVPGRTVVFTAPKGETPKGEEPRERPEPKPEVKVILKETKPERAPEIPKRRGLFERLLGSARKEMTFEVPEPPRPLQKPEPTKPEPKPVTVTTETPPSFVSPKRIVILEQRKEAPPTPKVRGSFFASVTKWFRRLFSRREPSQERPVLPPPPSAPRPIPPPPKPSVNTDAAVDRLVTELFKPPSTTPAVRQEAMAIPEPAPSTPPPPRSPDAKVQVASLPPAKPEPLPKPELTFDVNLMPADLKAAVAPRKRLAILAAAVILSILLVVGTSVGLAIYQRNITSQLAKLNEEIENLDRGIASFASFQQEVVELKGKIALIEQLLGQHTHWTALFAHLERTTLPEVYYSSLIGDVGGKVTLAAGTKDFQSVARQLLIFRQANDFVMDVSITGAKVVTSATTGATPGAPVVVPAQRVEFTVFLTVKPEIFTSH